MCVAVPDTVLAQETTLKVDKKKKKLLFAMSSSSSSSSNVTRSGGGAPKVSASRTGVKKRPPQSVLAHARTRSAPHVTFYVYYRYTSPPTKNGRALVFLQLQSDRYPGQIGCAELPFGWEVTKILPRLPREALGGQPPPACRNFANGLRA